MGGGCSRSVGCEDGWSVAIEDGGEVLVVFGVEGFSEVRGCVSWEFDYFLVYLRANVC